MQVLIGMEPGVRTSKRPPLLACDIILSALWEPHNSVKGKVWL